MSDPMGLMLALSMRIDVLLVAYTIKWEQKVQVPKQPVKSFPERGLRPRLIALAIACRGQ